MAIGTYPEIREDLSPSSVLEQACTVVADRRLDSADHAEMACQTFDGVT